MGQSGDSIDELMGYSVEPSNVSKETRKMMVQYRARYAELLQAHYNLETGGGGHWDYGCWIWMLLFGLFITTLTAIGGVLIGENSVGCWALSLIIIFIIWYLYAKKNEGKIAIQNQVIELQKLGEELKVQIEKDMDRVYKQKTSSKLKQTHIILDVNQLLKQIQREGLAIPYKCPNCSSTLKITGSEKIYNCPYCDSSLDTHLLSDLITALM